MYQFTNDCLIGIDTIDEEHRRLFQLVNEASARLENPANLPTVVQELIPALKDYAATHFKHEEEYMEKINDPELPLQKKEHAAFTEKISQMDPNGDYTQEDIKELLTYLVRWLYHHILSSDLMIGKLPRKEDKVKNNDPFAFTDNYLTGIQKIDEQHAKLFDIIRDVSDVIHNNTLHDKYDEIIRLLTELKNYTETHFHEEEDYMESINYPGLIIQQRAHSAFVEKLVGINMDELEEIDDNQDEYLEHLIEFLIGWLSNHILKKDKQIAEYVRSKEKIE